MAKTLLLLPLLLVSLTAFNIYETALSYKTETLKDIPWPFTTCGQGKWTIQKLTLGSTPARNTNDDITVLGTADDDISFTTCELEVKLNGVFLHSESIPFAQSFGAGDTVQFKFQNYIPSFAPPGTYGLTFKFKSGSSDNGCLAFSFKL